MRGDGGWEREREEEGGRREEKRKEEKVKGEKERNILGLVSIKFEHVIFLELVNNFSSNIRSSIKPCTFD